MQQIPLSAKRSAPAWKCSQRKNGEVYIDEN